MPQHSFKGTGVAAVLLLISLYVVGPKGLAQQATNCAAWNTGEFFERSTVEDATACLAAGADVHARDERDLTPLHWAAARTLDPAVLEALLAAGAEPDARGSDAVIGITPLHAAAEGNENPAALRVLLAAGADPIARGSDGRTPLHLAAQQNGNPEIVEELLAAGANLEARDDDGRTPLYRATEERNAAAVGVLLAVGAEADPTQVINDRTLLHVAATIGSSTVIAALLAAGADPMAQTRNGRTPLHFAAQSNQNLDAFDVLLAAGADLQAGDQDGNTALHHAAWGNENLATMEALLAAGADVRVRQDQGATPLALAAINNGNPAVLEALLAAGADPNVRDQDGRSPLYLAADNNENPAVIEVLLAADADPDVRDQDGDTPLHRAALQENLELISALLSGGADPNVRDQDGATPLHWAARRENLEVVGALVAGGADPNARDQDGDMPLHRAADSNENANVLAVLLASGADANAPAIDGAAPLHRAAEGNAKATVVEALLAAGADPDVRDDDGNTPLHRAALRSSGVAAIEGLLGNGADASARNTAGHTPWDLAQGNYDLRGSYAYWWLNDARLNLPRPDAPPAPASGRAAAAPNDRAELDDTVSVHGNWTIRVLRDGDLRFCYLETGLIASDDADAALRARRLQATPSSFSGGPVVRVSSDRPYWVSMAAESSNEPDDSYTQVDERSKLPGGAELVNALRVGEAESRSVLLWPNTDSEAVDPEGQFSLMGFSVAYDTIGISCPDHPREIAETSLPAEQMVSVSDIARTTEDLPQPGIAAQFSITGPFFRRKGRDTLMIKAIQDSNPSYNAVRDSNPWNPDNPAAFLRYGTDSLEFYRNGSLFYSGGPFLGGTSNDFLGVCLDPKSQRLKLLTSSWSGGASDPANAWVLWFSDEHGIDYSRLSARDSVSADSVDCAEDEILWQWGSRFRPCSCIGPAGNDDYRSTKRRLLGDIEAATAVSGDSPSIDHDVLSTLVDRISIFQSFARWDLDSEIGVERFQSEKFEILEINYRHFLLADYPFQFVLARVAEHEDWRLLYEKPWSPKVNNRATIHGFTDEETLDLDVCVDDCTWWGRHKRVQWHLGKRFETASSPE